MFVQKNSSSIATLDSTVDNNDYLVKNEALFRPRSQAITCIHPAKLRRVGIEGQPIGQAQVILHQDPPVCAIHVGSFNFGVISVPICPIKIPGGKGSERGREIMKMYEKKFT